MCVRVCVRVCGNGSQKQISVEMGNFMLEIFARPLDRLDIIQLRFAAIERTFATSVNLKRAI